MVEIADFLMAWLVANKVAVLGGFVGGLASLRLHPSPTAVDKICNALFGMAAGVFIAPLINEYFKLGQHLLAGMSFFIALLALPTMINFVKAIPEWLAGAKSLFFNRFGGNPNGNSDR